MAAGEGFRAELYFEVTDSRRSVRKLDADQEELYQAYLDMHGGSMDGEPQPMTCLQIVQSLVPQLELFHVAGLRGSGPGEGDVLVRHGGVVRYLGDKARQLDRSGLRQELTEVVAYAPKVMRRSEEMKTEQADLRVLAMLEREGSYNLTGPIHDALLPMAENIQTARSRVREAVALLSILHHHSPGAQVVTLVNDIADENLRGLMGGRTVKGAGYAREPKGSVARFELRRQPGALAVVAGVELPFPTESRLLAVELSISLDGFRQITELISYAKHG